MTAYTNLVLNSAFKARALTEDEIRSIIDGYNEESKMDVIRFATRKKRLPFIGKMFCSLGIDDNFWKIVIEKYRKRNAYMIEILTHIFDTLNKYDVKKIFVYENFGAMLASDTDVSQFASGDIDIYAKFEEREKIEVALAECGFFQKNASDERELVVSCYYCEALKEQFYLSVMWQALSRKKLPFNISVDHCVEWNNLTYYHDTKIQLPKKEALMYMCILHVSVHGYSREPDLRLYKDIENLSHLDVDWKTVYEMSQYDRKEVRVITVVTIACLLIGIPVPKWLMNEKKNFGHRVDKLLRIVYDTTQQSLRYSPHGIDLVMVEAYSDYNSLLTGILGMVFPPSNWIRWYFLHNDKNLLLGYIKHIKNIMRG